MLGMWFLELVMGGCGVCKIVYGFFVVMYNLIGDIRVFVYGIWWWVGW